MAGAPYLRVIAVDRNEVVEEFEARDLERIRVGVQALRALLDDPIALIDRAKRLLEGTAPKLFTLFVNLALSVDALAALDIPGPFDDWARLMAPGLFAALLP
jgi:hypothetical protein